MDGTFLLAGILPLFVFAVVDSFLGVRMAVVAAIVLSLIEAGFSYHLLGEIDWLTMLSLGLVVLMALISYRTRKGIYFKFQPVILGLLFSGTLLVTYSMGKPIIYEFMMKYKDQLSPYLPISIKHPLIAQYFKKVTMTAGICLGLHALLVAYAAWKWSRWWWLIIRILGFYAFLAIAAFWASGSITIKL